MNESPNLFADGKAYERLMGRWSKLAGEKFLDWLDAPKNQKWLDVGCGNGAFTEVLIAQCAPAAVIGVDPSEGQLAYARGRTGTKRAEFRVADAQALPFPDKSFDAATMALVIVFIPDPAKAAREMARVVRPGGIVATYMWEFPDGFPLAPLAAAMKDLGLTPPERPNVEASARDAMRAIWKAAGLSAIESEVIRIRVNFTSFDDFWDSNTVPVGPSGKALSELTHSAREQLKTRLRERLPIAADGSIAYEAFAYAVKGVVA
ncbi:MAG TPA: class I SAM-dependent methyltransferase [Xanthobacteraceae bacterium]|jgi:SAM-dependent methyltransferase|nr:class I SAM-dependent methyltransferase [Xanthobacteraceae bacterium]